MLREVFAVRFYPNGLEEAVASGNMMLPILFDKKNMSSEWMNLAFLLCMTNMNYIISHNFQNIVILVVLK